GGGAAARGCRPPPPPRGPEVLVPAEPVSIAVALADKLDTLAGFWAIDEKPTGSKDPYALRRAALGIIRLVLDNGLRLRLLPVFKSLFENWSVVLASRVPKIESGIGKTVVTPHEGELLSFFFDRLKVQLREQGARHDLVDAVLAQHGEGHDDLVLIVRRVEALGKFLSTDDGKSLLAGVKRASNILRIEEKKGGVTYHGKLHPDLYLQPEEPELAAAIHPARDQS